MIPIYSVRDERYNAVRYNGGFARPFGLATALLIRGVRGGVIILDTSGSQVYKPVSGRLAGEDYVCETCNTLWSLGHRGGPVAVERRRGGARHPCPGYPGLRAHQGEHLFLKKHLVSLYLRHGLRLRIVLARSKVGSTRLIYFLPFIPLTKILLIDFQVLAALFFKRLYAEYFPDDSSAQCEDACKWTLRSMSDSLRRAAEDGVLFAGGNAGRFGPGHRVVVGEGDVRRDDCPELQRTFASSNVNGLDLYARCYEFTHWSPVMTAIGKSTPLFNWFIMVILLLLDLLFA